MSNRRILIIGPSWVGDMVMAQTLFKVLRQLHPGCEIDVLAPAWSKPLLDRMPEVRKGLSMPVGHGQLQLGTRLGIGRELREAGYDQAIVLPNSLKSALIPFFAKIPQRTGWRGEMRYGLLNDVRKLNKAHYPLMIERFVALALPEGAVLPQPIPRPALTVDQKAAAKLLEEKGLAGKVLALCPGAEFGPAKRWPDKHYAAVAAEYVGRGWQVVLMGSAKDSDVAERIRSALPPTAAARCVNLCGKTSLGQAIDILSQATAVVSNDSGLMHISAALGRPLAVVYGSTSPGFTPPLAERVAVEQIPVDCGPCFKRECPLGHLKCLVDLEPARVIRSLDALLVDGPVSKELI
ncbi:heptosyltransferase-2 [Litorivivens lipolytica]|uniref:lipopolysaccharide heptosyltransferase II n=1 Tax=Litorivivens lipolytica TaxID=1524264 RepID=A0A7W4W4M0_9GAMM|nr:lipopolysaccharide heptosyltransferase II [Litorivivens lipolytica]MBB3047319.1 heptosyltransferase-2 [Litorivivens lipolytica]